MTDMDDRQGLLHPKLKADIDSDGCMRQNSDGVGVGMTCMSQEGKCEVL